MKVSNATTHVKYYASHQMMITKLQTFNDLENFLSAEKNLKVLKSNMEKNNWVFNSIRIPKFDFSTNLDKNQITTYSEFMFGTQIHPLIAFQFKDTIYDSMVNATHYNDEPWFYKDDFKLIKLRNQNWGFKDYSLENFIIRGTKPLGKDEPHWDIAYVDLEAFCECTNDDRKKAFRFYESQIT
tara:strand:- start:155 stop:703 length:549 start_codon:yes stop_codon:yes gene_type:complete